MRDTVKIKTNMRCDSCVAKVRPALEAVGISDGLGFDMNSPDKTVTFLGDANQAKKAISVLKVLGYSADPIAKTSTSETIAFPSRERKSLIETYKPLLLIGAFLVLATSLVEIKAGVFDTHRAACFHGWLFPFLFFF